MSPLARTLLPALVVLLTSAASAEPRRTTAPVTLRARPGERQAAVVTVPAGVVIEVLEEHGRWLKIRVGKAGKAKVGWVTRTTVTAVAGAPAAPAAAPAPTASWSAAAAVPAAAVPTPAAAAVATAVAPVQPPRTAGRLAARAEARLGYRSLDMRFTSDGGGGLANYVVSADAAAVEVDSDVVARPGPRWLALGLDATARFSYSSPGLDYMGPSRPAGDIPFSVVEVDAGLRLGVHRPAFGVAVRAGVHYGAFLTDEVANPGLLPRERLRGLTGGVRLDVAPRRSRVQVTATIDLMVAGDRRQTPGLEDGASSDAGGLWAGAVVRYALRRRLAVLGGVGYARATTAWQGPSVRQPDVTAAERVDASQLIQLGLGAEL